jgi:hypothetical protein
MEHKTGKLRGQRNLMWKKKQYQKALIDGKFIGYRAIEDKSTA